MIIADRDREIFSLEMVRDSAESLLDQLNRLPDYPEIESLRYIASLAMHDAKVLLEDKMRRE